MEDTKISKYTMECIMLYHYRIFKSIVIALIISLLVTVCTIFGCLWYMSLPVEESYADITQEQDGTNNNMIGVNNGEADY